MRLTARIVAFILLTAVFPLLGLAFAAAGVAQEHVEAAILGAQIDQAEAFAERIARQLDDTERVLELQVANFRLETAPDEARSAFLLATYRLFPEISVAMLVDGDGDEVVPPVFRSGAETGGLAEVIARHDVVTEARVARLRSALPQATTPGQAVRGRPYVIDDAGDAAVIPMTIPSPWGDGLALGVELSLASVAARMEAGVGTEREVMLMTQDGVVLLRAGRAGLVEPDKFRVLLSTESAGVRYGSVFGVDVLAASARVPDRDWVVAVAEPADAVARGIQAIRERTGYIGGFAVLFALVAGVLLSRSILAPVLRIREAAIAVGEGDLTRRVAVDGQDELAELAGAFNRMSEGLEANEAELRAKNAEIEAFNRELQERVESRTAELREAQGRLVQSGQLAAVAELSAGLAHELNNPLAGILGIVQIVKGRHPGDSGLLDAAEREALRCRDIVANLLRFTRPAGGDARADGEVVDLDGVLHDVLALVGGPFRDRGVSVEFVPAGEPMQVRGDPAQLGRALGQLLTSLRSVARPGSSVRIAGTRDGRHLEYRFEVGGTTAETDDWRAAGMGFWVARQVFQEHQATLDEPVGDRGGPRAWRLVAPVATS